MPATPRAALMTAPPSGRRSLQTELQDGITPVQKRWRTCPAARRAAIPKTRRVARNMIYGTRYWRTRAFTSSVPGETEQLCRCIGLLNLRRQECRSHANKRELRASSICAVLRRACASTRKRYRRPSCAGRAVFSSPRPEPTRRQSVPRYPPGLRAGTGAGPAGPFFAASCRPQLFEASRALSAGSAMLTVLAGTPASPQRRAPGRRWRAHFAMRQRRTPRHRRPGFEPRRRFWATPRKNFARRPQKSSRESIRASRKESARTFVATISAWPRCSAARHSVKPRRERKLPSSAAPLRSLARGGGRLRPRQRIVADLATTSFERHAGCASLSAAVSGGGALYSESVNRSD